MSYLSSDLIFLKVVTFIVIQIEGEHQFKVNLGPTVDRFNLAGPSPVPMGTRSVLVLGATWTCIVQVDPRVLGR